MKKLLVTCAVMFGLLFTGITSVSASSISSVFKVLNANHSIVLEAVPVEEGTEFTFQPMPEWVPAENGVIEHPRPNPQLSEDYPIPCFIVPAQSGGLVLTQE